MIEVVAMLKNVPDSTTVYLWWISMLGTVIWTEVQDFVGKYNHLSSLLFLHLMKEMCMALTQTLALYVGHTFGHYKCHSFWKFWRIAILGVLTVVNTLAVYIDVSFHWLDGNLFCMLASASVEHNACRLKCGSFGCLLQMTFTLTTLLWCVMLLTLLESW